MNLQGRIISGLLLAATLIFFGCENPSVIGLELDPNENNVGVYEKEFILPSSVILNDSINTTRDSRLLVGKFDDPFFGTATAKAFSQVTRDGEFVAINTNGVLDSIIFNFEMSYVHGEYGAFFQSINVYQLTDTLFANSNVSYFADDTTRYATRNPIAAKSFIYSPTKDTIIRIKAEPFWAADFFNKFLDGTDANELQNDVKGFALIPGNENTFVFGFNPVNSNISMHYHTEADDSLVYRLSFNTSGQNAVRYNHISADRSRTELESLTEAGDEIIPASGKLYTQAGTGIHTKISLEPVRNFIDSLGNIIINRAEILIGPVDPLTSLEYYVKPPLTLAFIKGDSVGNNFWAYQQLTDQRLFNYVVMSDQGYIGLNSQLKLFPPYDSASRTYDGVPTLFLQYLRDDLIEFNDIVVLPADRTSLNRFIVPADNIRFKIHYTNLD